MDLATLRGWIEGIGYGVDKQGPKALRITPPGKEGKRLPPFYVQVAENWVMLSMLPLLPSGHRPSRQAMLRMLILTREMRTAKLALGEEGEAVLCAELPTESLDREELVDAVTRMVEYAKHYLPYLVAV